MRTGEGGEGVHVSVEQAELLVLKGEIGPDTLVQTQQSVRTSLQSMMLAHLHTQ